jgi:hypothetical protein
VSRPVSVTLLALAGLVLFSSLFFKSGRNVLDAKESKV